MLPLPSNGLERFSVKGFGLITGHFPWIKSGGVLHTDSVDDSISNLCFCKLVFAERFCVKWRKRLTVVSEEFNESVKCFWLVVFDSIALWLGMTLAHLPVMRQPPMMLSRFSLTVALSNSAIVCTKLGGPQEPLDQF